MTDPEAPAGQRESFECTADGAVASAQRRMARFFSLLGLALLVGVAFAFSTGQAFAGALTLALAFGVFVIYRMSRELDPTELVIENGTLVILMRHALRRLPLAEAAIRRLTDDEIEHLTGLASSGGFVAGAGGFDSHLLGEFDLYATRLENAVLLETTDGRVVVTPDQPGAFAAAVSRASS